MSAPQLDLCTTLTESKRIIKAHKRHFLALSVLFLVPLSFSLSVFPTLQQLLLHSPTPNAQFLLTDTFYDSAPMLDVKTLIISLVYIVSILILSLCGIGSITYSVFHGFYGRPVKLLSAIKSILSSLLPLLATTLVCEMIVFGVLVIFAIFLFFVVKLVNLLGFQFDYSSPYFLGFFVIYSIVLVLVLVYLHVNWTLVSVIVVVESSWGLNPLKRSTRLIKGYRLLALSLCFYLSFLPGILVWCCSEVLHIGDDNGDYTWKNLANVYPIVTTSALLTLAFLYNAAANTVLYMYCKAMHGELAMEIAEEFAKEYVSLPFDDEKVPHLVSVVYA